ncbi:MAG: SpoIIE family protein phosphatase [bacterium]|nr:SpoIIE family protein phosphatase [bacterium]
MNILIADDEPVARTLLAATLRSWGYEVLTASNGMDAWQIVQQAAPPELCIFDWNMPGLDGVDVIRKIRALSRGNYIYSMILTGKDTRDDVVAGMDAGADDYLIKPFDPRELRVRLRVAERILSQQQQLEKARTRELVIAARIQQTLLFDRPMRNMPWADVAVMAKPAGDVGGDFYGFVEHSGGAFDLTLGDVMGKGISAALVSAGIKSRLLNALLGLIAARTQAERPAPVEVVAIAHRETTSELIDLESLITLVYARLDQSQRTCTYVDCGHMPIIHVMPHAQRFALLKSSHVPLGFLCEEVYTQGTVPYAAGDVFVFYSDGLTDARSPARVPFGVPRLAALVLDRAADAARDIMAAIADALAAHCQTDNYTDDCTCIVIRILT